MLVHGIEYHEQLAKSRGKEPSQPKNSHWLAPEMEFLKPTPVQPIRPLQSDTFRTTASGSFANFGINNSSNFAALQNSVVISFGVPTLQRALGVGGSSHQETQREPIRYEEACGNALSPLAVELIPSSLKQEEVEQEVILSPMTTVFVPGWEFLEEGEPDNGGGVKMINSRGAVELGACHGNAGTTGT